MSTGIEAGGPMSCKKTTTVVLAIIIVSVVMLSLHIIGGISGLDFLPEDTEREASLLMYLFVPLVAGLLFTLIAYLMLIWDSGDKIPPLVMGGLGFLGLFPIFYYLLPVPYDIYDLLKDLMSPLMWSPAHHFMTGLYIAFGVLGLFTRRKPG
jgi:hypothetical protein